MRPSQGAALPARAAAPKAARSRWAIVLAAAACGGERTDDRPASSPPATPRKSVDVTTLPGTQVQIRGVEVETRADGSLAVTYRIETEGSQHGVGDRNLVYPASPGDCAVHGR